MSLIDRIKQNRTEPRKKIEDVVDTSKTVYDPIEVSGGGENCYEPVLKLFCNGYKSGDAGHGGKAILTLDGGETANGVFRIKYSDGSYEEFDILATDAVSFEFELQGGCEQLGLLGALRDIARHIPDFNQDARTGDCPPHHEPPKEDQ